jgi:hypothetical protein
MTGRRLSLLDGRSRGLMMRTRVTAFSQGTDFGAGATG